MKSLILILFADWVLADYNGLDQVLDSLEETDEPMFVSLGSDGYYYMCTEHGRRFYCLPEGARERINKESDTDPVDKVWLGADGAYVVKTDHGNKHSQLRGNYSWLAGAMRGSPKIAALDLNLSDDGSYAVMFVDNSVDVGPGTNLTTDTLEEWARRIDVDVL